MISFCTESKLGSKNLLRPSQDRFPFFYYVHENNLPDAVTAVNDQIVTSHVGAGVRNQVNVGTLKLLSLTVAAHGNHRVPQILDLLIDEVGETSVDVSGGDAVNTSKVAPLVGERASHVDAASLGDVVRCLFLREVGDVAGHGGGDDEGAGTALLEVVTHSLSAVESTVQVGLDNLLPVTDGAIQDTAVGSTTSVGDEGVDLAEVLNDGLDETLDALPVTNIALVGLNCDTILLGQLLGVPLTTLGAGGVGDSEVGTHLGAATGSFDTHTTGTGSTGDDDDLALEAKEVLKAIGLGNGDRHGGG